MTVRLRRLIEPDSWFSRILQTLPVPGFSAAHNGNPHPTSNICAHLRHLRIAPLDPIRTERVTNVLTRPLIFSTSTAFIARRRGRRLVSQIGRLDLMGSSSPRRKPCRDRSQ